MKADPGPNSNPESDLDPKIQVFMRHGVVLPLPIGGCGIAEINQQHLPYEAPDLMQFPKWLCFELNNLTISSSIFKLRVVISKTS
jgi:hypothetical protein